MGKVPRKFGNPELIFSLEEVSILVNGSPMKYNNSDMV